MKIKVLIGVLLLAMIAVVAAASVAVALTVGEKLDEEAQIEDVIKNCSRYSDSTPYSNNTAWELLFSGYTEGQLDALWQDMFGSVGTSQTHLYDIVISINESDPLEASATDYYRHWEISNSDTGKWYFEEGTHNYELTKMDTSDPPDGVVDTWKITEFIQTPLRSETRNVQ